MIGLLFSAVFMLIRLYIMAMIWIIRLTVMLFSALFSSLGVTSSGSRR